MTILTAVLMLAVLPFVLLSVFVGITGLPLSVYDKAADNRAKGEYYVNGEVPDKVTVLGREITVTAANVDIASITRFGYEQTDYNRAMVEQALINTCISLQAKCKKDDINLVWAFLPSTSGKVSDITAGSSSATLDCTTATSTEYARYGRYLFQTAIPTTLLTDTSTGRVMYYSKPPTGTGCSFNDLVDMR